MQIPRNQPCILHLSGDSLWLEVDSEPLRIDMEAARCQAHPEHRAMWECSCSQPAPHFCTTCLPLHTQSAGQHTLTPVGPMGPYTCGLCQGQSSDPITCQYPVCLCQRCIQNSSAAQAHLLPGRPAEIAANQAAEGLRVEAEVNLQAAQPLGRLQEVFHQRKNDLNQNITDLRANLNEFEAAFSQALNQEAQLQACLAQLAQAQEELLRLRAGQHL